MSRKHSEAEIEEGMSGAQVSPLQITKGPDSNHEFGDQARKSLNSLFNRVFVLENAIQQHGIEVGEMPK